MDILRQHSIRVNFLLNFFLKAVNVLCSAAAYGIAYRVLGVANVGKVAFAISVTSFFAMIATLGIPTYGIRECAGCRDNRQLLSKTVRELLMIQCAMTLISVLLLALSVGMIPRLREDLPLFLIEGLLLLLGATGTEWLYAGLERYGYITIRTAACKLLSLLLVFLFVRKQTDVLTYAMLLAFSNALLYILNLLSLRKLIDPQQSGERCEPKRHLRPALFFFAQTVAITVYTSLDSAMLGFLSGDYWVGIYDASVKIKLILSYFTTSLGAVLFPRLSYYAHENNKKKFWEKVNRSAEFTVLTAVPLAIFVFCMSEECIAFLFGEQYLPGAPALRILSLTLILIGGSSLLGAQILMTTGRERVTMRAVTVGAVVDAVLNLLLISRYAGMGAALGTLAAEIMVLTMEMAYLKSIMRNLLRESEALKTLSVSAVAAVVLFFVKIRLSFQPFLMLLTGAMAYFTLVYGVLYCVGEPMVRQTLDKVCALCRKIS